MSTKGRPLLKLPFTAEAAVKRQRFVTAGAADNKVKPAVANSPVVGVADRPAKVGNPVDVDVLGAVPVVYGGAVTRGARVVSDADGRAVVAPATPAIPDEAGITDAKLRTAALGLKAAADARIAGIALRAGAANDIGLVLLSAS